MAKQIKKVSLLIFSIANAGGCERITCGLANELTRRQYDVSIIKIYNSSHSFFSLHEKVKILPVYKKETRPSKYHFPFVPFRILNLLRKKEHRPDVLIGVGTDMSIYGLLVIKLLKTPFISWEHFNFNVGNTDFLAALGRKLSARYARFLVVLTQKDKSLFEANLPVAGEVVCIPNFMTFAVQQTSPVTSSLAIAMGRYTRQKGFDNLVAIWDVVSRQNPEWQLQIIGKGEDKPLLEKMIAERKLENKITLVPLSKDVSEYYKKASVFLLSSRWEGLPMVAIEAKSFGLPIVSFDCETGPRDLIENNKDGILVKDGDNGAFATVLSDLLQNRQRLQEMGRQALQNSNRFSPEQILSLWENLFSAIAAEKNSDKK